MSVCKCVCPSVCMCACMCVCVCVCERESVCTVIVLSCIHSRQGQPDTTTLCAGRRPFDQGPFTKLPGPPWAAQRLLLLLRDVAMATLARNINACVDWNHIVWDLELTLSAFPRGGLPGKATSQNLARHVA